MADRNGSVRTFGDLLAGIMKYAPPEIEEYSKLPKEEQLRILVNECNAEVDEEGMKAVPCETCHGKGIIYSEDGNWWHTKECSCMKSRRALSYVDRLGLTELVKASTFDKFVVDSDFTKALKEKVISYAKESTGEWLYLGGQSGCGKTHLAMAIFGRLIHQHKAPRVMLWIQDSQRIKSLVTDEEEYNREVFPLQNAEVLIIDDFFNTVPTQADIKLARTIIDNRYINNLPTIITSELMIPELYEYDDALAGRIVEKCGAYCIQIATDEKKNHRMRGIQTL